MYPRNAASPERIAIGSVVQISDGAVQTSGVSVKVLPIGTTASAGGGTIAYEEGIVHYLPTQAETNYTSFVLVAYKTGCIPAAVTIVTSASATAGYAGLDWSALRAATTTVNLSATTIKTATDVETDTADIQSRLPAALVSGRIDASVGAMASNTLTAAALASDAVAEIQSGLSTLDAAGVRTAVGLATANLDTQIGTLATASNLAVVAGYLDTEIAAIKAKTDNLPASPAATGDIPTAAAIADAVWDEAIAGHAGAGSTGEALSAAGAAGDPWITALPGAYSAGQAGYIVGTALDATMSSRASQSSLDTLDNYVDTEVAAIKAKTDLIPASPAAVSDIPTATENADALLNRDMSAVSDTNSRSPLNALRHIRNKWSVSGTTLTVTKEDDTTSAWTSTLSTNASADPITGSDPA